MINLQAKFKVPSFIRSKDRTGAQKFIKGHVTDPDHAPFIVWFTQSHCK